MRWIEERSEEQERLFASRWLCVGREEQIAKPGQHKFRPCLFKPRDQQIRAGLDDEIQRGQDF